MDMYRKMREALARLDEVEARLDQIAQNIAETTAPPVLRNQAGEEIGPHDEVPGPAEVPDVVEVLEGAGYEVVEGVEAVREAIKTAEVGDEFRGLAEQVIEEMAEEGEV